MFKILENIGSSDVWYETRNKKLLEYCGKTFREQKKSLIRQMTLLDFMIVKMKSVYVYENPNDITCCVIWNFITFFLIIVFYNLQTHLNNILKSSDAKLYLNSHGFRLATPII